MSIIRLIPGGLTNSGNGNDLVHINEVTQRRGRLVLGWVTFRGYCLGK